MPLVVVAGSSVAERSKRKLRCSVKLSVTLSDLILTATIHYVRVLHCAHQPVSCASLSDPAQPGPQCYTAQLTDRAAFGHSSLQTISIAHNTYLVSMEPPQLDP